MLCVGGGNIMHLIESLSRTPQCHAVVNEVAAGIAAEYFNETGNGRKALALVTAGPGLTIIVTAMAGAFLESRELLVIGGQVKTADLAHGQLRQRAFRKLMGYPLHAQSAKIRVVHRASRSGYFSEPGAGVAHRTQGPCFFSKFRWMCKVEGGLTHNKHPLCMSLPAQASDKQIAHLASKPANAKRPVILLGGAIQRTVATAMEEKSRHWHTNHHHMECRRSHRCR